ncbi:MAG: Yip1 family protein [Pseudomonadota bacterium]
MKDARSDPAADEVGSEVVEVSGSGASAAVAVPQSLTGRIFRAWKDPRTTMRGVLDANPSEGRILMFAMASGVLLFMAECFRIMLQASRSGAALDQLSATFTASFVALLVLRPLMLYGLAALTGLIARRAGGTGSWRDTRAAICWTALTAAPISVLATFAEVLLIQAGIAGVSLGPIGVAAFAGMMAYCIAEAHGFSRVWVVFSIIAGVTLAVWGLALSSA